MQRVNTIATATLAGADVAALVGLRPDLGRLTAGLAAPHAWISRAGTDGALVELASAALWLAAAWLAFGLAAVAAARLPGVPGRVGVAVAGLVLPAALRGVLAGCAGLGVLLAPVAAGASQPSGAAPGPAVIDAVPHPTLRAVGDAVACSSRDGSALTVNILAPTARRNAAPDTAHAASAAAARDTASYATCGAAPAAAQHNGPDAVRDTVPRPARQTPGGTASGAAADTAGLPSPGWPTGADSAAATPLPAPGWPVAHHPDADGTARPVTVQRGDSLWLIAARRLGAQATPHDVAAAWPRWYAANREVIGHDPALITPGQVLHAPVAAAKESHR